MNDPLYLPLKELVVRCALCGHFTPAFWSVSQSSGVLWLEVNPCTLCVERLAKKRRCKTNEID